MKILAAIVTFNRCDLLARCLNCIAMQTRPPDEVLVVNNGSSDDTLSMLEKHAVAVITQDNVGSAGGWHRAIEYALNGEFDAVWLMDDDGFPDKLSLAHLEQSLRPGIACASSIVIREDRPNIFVFPFPILNEEGLPKIFSLPRKIATVDELQLRTSSGIYPYAHLFNGALVSCKAVHTVGNVNREFFIFGDEVDFFFRLRSAGDVVSVISAKHFHPDVSQRPYTPIKVYYYVKNSIILNSRYLNLVGLRNFLTLGVSLVRIARRNGLRELVSYLLGRRASVFYQAIVRGLQGRIGNDFHG